MKTGGLLALLAAGGLGAFFLLRERNGVAYALPTYQPSATLPKPSAYKPQSFETAFMSAENEYGLPSGILRSMAGIESSFRTDIIYCEILGASGEKGLMQIDPKWHAVDGCDPWAAIPYAGSYLRENFNRFGNWRYAVAAYNWGPTNLENKGYANMPDITRRYVDRVIAEVGI